MESEIYYASLLQGLVGIEAALRTLEPVLSGRPVFARSLLLHGLLRALNVLDEDCWAVEGGHK